MRIPVLAKAIKSCLMSRFNLIFSLILSTSFLGNAQSLDSVKLEDFSFRVYRRSSEFYQYPNAFIDFKNLYDLDVLMKVNFKQNRKSFLTLTTKKFSSNNFSVGRNGIKSSLLSYWSHKNPQLYDLQITLYTRAQDSVEFRLPVGIVDYRMDDGILKINNSDLSLNAITISSSLQVPTLKLLKRRYVNTLICHYIPTADEMLLLSKMGFYVLVDLTKNPFQNNQLDQLVQIMNYPSFAAVVIDAKDQKHKFEATIENVLIIDRVPVNVQRCKPSSPPLLALFECFQPYVIDYDMINEEDTSYCRLSIIADDEILPADSTIKLFINDYELKPNVYQLASPNKLEINLPDSTIFSPDSSHQLMMISSKKFDTFDANDTIAYFNLK